MLYSRQRVASPSVKSERWPACGYASLTLSSGQLPNGTYFWKTGNRRLLHSFVHTSLAVQGRPFLRSFGRSQPRIVGSLFHSSKGVRLDPRPNCLLLVIHPRSI